MAVVLKSQGSGEAIARTTFENEDELQRLLAENPSLLQDESEAPLAFVKREVNLGTAGSLDLLLISSDGLPVAVEVKLQRNSQSRREVVALLASLRRKPIFRNCRRVDLWKMSSQTLPKPVSGISIITFGFSVSCTNLSPGFPA